MTRKTPRDMTVADFEIYREEAVQTFAGALVRAFGRSPEDADAAARAQLAQILPDGRETAGHRFVLLPDDVGKVWYGPPPESAGPGLFLFDIRVEEQHRGRGHGRTAMLWLEDEARRLGEPRVVLAVFDYNEGAIRLYERLGYETIEAGPGGRRMAKAVST